MVVQNSDDPAPRGLSDDEELRRIGADAGADVNFEALEAIRNGTYGAGDGADDTIGTID